MAEARITSLGSSACRSGFPGRRHGGMRPAVREGGVGLRCRTKNQKELNAGTDLRHGDRVAGLAC